jgi:hypothetical protein
MSKQTDHKKYMIYMLAEPYWRGRGEIKIK